MTTQEARRHAYATFARNVSELTEAVQSDNQEREMETIDALISALESIKDVSEQGTTN